MEVIDGWPASPVAAGMVVALGNFDGVHLGHQALIRKTNQKAAELKAASTVLTFHPHPSWILEPERFPGLLTTREDKIELLGRLGVERLIFIPFSPELANIEAGRFVREELQGRLHPLAVGVGYNFTFGRGGEGTPELLLKLGRELGFEVFVLPPVEVAGRPISSSGIREALQAGDIELARSFLGRWPAVRGLVVEGQRRGRELGFPTANLEVTPGLLLPAAGVYAALARWNGRQCLAAVNLGNRPTFGAGLRYSVEAHLIDFAGDLYGRVLELELHRRLREELPFPGPGELAKQIARDVARVKDYFATGK